MGVLTDRRLYPSRVLHGQVAHRVGREIVAGKIREGDFLPRENEMAARFGVSRQAVREALKVLAAKGLVGSRRRMGTFVLPRSSWNLFDPDIIAWHPTGQAVVPFLRDVVELRFVIEPAAAEMAARRAVPDRVAAIEAALDEMRRCMGTDADGLHKADARFHMAIQAASGNDLLERLGALIAPLLEAALRQQNASRLLDDASFIEDHEAVYRAIASGNPAKARKAMEHTLSYAWREVDAIAMAQLENAVLAKAGRDSRPPPSVVGPTGTAEEADGL